MEGENPARVYFSIFVRLDNAPANAIARAVGSASGASF